MSNPITRTFLRVGSAFRRVFPGGSAATPTALPPGPTPADLAGVMVPNIDQKVPLAQGDLWSARALVDPSRLIAGRFFYPFNPSLLVTRKGLAIFDQMKLDEQVKVCLAFKKNTMLQAGWEVVSPGDQPADWEVTQFVHDQFDHMPNGADDFLRKIMLGLDFGYSVTEKIFGDASWAPGKVGLIAAISIKPHYIDIQADRHGNVLGLVQRYAPGQGWSVPGDNVATPGAPSWVNNPLGGWASGAPGTRGIPAMPPDKFILYTHDIEFENHYGRSELESAYRPWWVKDNAYKWLAILLERFGMPPMFFFYDPAAYQGQQLTELQKIINSIKNATMGLIPRAKKDTIEISTVQVAREGKDVFLAALGRFDGDIAAALLMPSLLGSSSNVEQLSGGKGSYARANVHFKNFLSVVRAQGRMIATRAVNAQFVRQLCDLNFPGLKSYPEFRFLDPDDDTELALFELWQKLVTGGSVNRIPDDEQHIRKSLHFPDNDNPVVEPLPEKPGPFGSEPGQGGADKGEEGAPIAEAKLSDEMRAFAAENDGVWMMIAGHPMCFRREAIRATN